MQPFASRARTAAAPANAKSPCRRLTSWYDQPAFPGNAVTAISNNSSSGCSAVVMYDRKKSSAPTERRVVFAHRTIDASSVTMATGNSAEGKACAKLPPTVPRLRIWIWPMNAAASRSSGQRLATSGERSSSRWRVVAPMRSAASSSGRRRAGAPDRRTAPSSPALPRWRSDRDSQILPVSYSIRLYRLHIGVMNR